VGWATPRKRCGRTCSREKWRGRISEAIKQGSFKEEDLPKFACQIAAEVKDFDPLQFIEKKTEEDGAVHPPGHGGGG